MLNKSVKSVIAPIQNWLMGQGRCVGCSMPIEKGKHAKHKSSTKITCKCGRIYVKNSRGEFRRALLEEV